MATLAINAQLAEADAFIQNAQDGGPIQAAFAEIGRGAESGYFAEGQTLLDAARSLHQAQQATEQREAALRALAAWVSEGQALARVLLADQPQQLEKLGLVVRS